MTPNELFGPSTGSGTTDNNTGFVSFEEIEAAFKTPTQYQQFYEQPETPSGAGYAPSDDLPPSLVNPEGEDLNFDEPAPKVDHDHAMRTGERIAKVIDTGIDFTLSNFVARNDESYRADERDLRDIAECWGELAEEKGWSIGPEWSLIILYIMVYGPLVKQAVTDRRVAELEARQKMLEERMDAYEYQPPTVKITPKPANDGNPSPSPAPAPTSSPFTYQPQK